MIEFGALAKMELVSGELALLLLILSVGDRLIKRPLKILKHLETIMINDLQVNLGVR